MTVAAGGLLVAGAEVPEEARVGVGRWVDRLAKDDLLVGTRAAQQCETRCPEGNAANVALRVVRIRTACRLLVYDGDTEDSLLYLGFP
jgi:hypothetical protein